MPKPNAKSSRSRPVIPTIQGPVDRLNYTVSVIEPIIKSASGKPSRIGSATGLFFEHKGGFYLVTNRHAVIDEDEQFYPDHLKLRVHTSDKVLTKNRSMQVPLYKQNGERRWLEHPDQKPGKTVDLIAIDIGDLLQAKDVISYWSQTSFFSTSYQMGVGETIVVLGYPLGFYDRINNLPIARSGTVATPYWVGFEDNPFFLVDSRLDKGTSGSPVITIRSPFRITERSTFVSGNFPARLLGVNSGEYSKEIPLGLNAVWYPELIPDIIEGRDDEA